MDFKRSALQAREDAYLAGNKADKNPPLLMEKMGIRIKDKNER